MVFVDLPKVNTEMFMCPQYVNNMMQIMDIRFYSFMFRNFDFNNITNQP